MVAFSVEFGVVLWVGVLYEYVRVYECMFGCGVSVYVLSGVV